MLTSIIGSFNSAMDFTKTFDSFYDLVWNILTAQGYGLDVWGRIVGVSRNTPIPSSTITYLGFNEANSWTGFNQGILFSGGITVSTVVLNDNDFRRLILAKMTYNISDGSIPTINKILLGLFPNRGACYVADGLNMSLTYTFPFILTSVELAIISLSGVLPSPAGVVVNIVQL